MTNQSSLGVCTRLYVTVLLKLGCIDTPHVLIFLCPLPTVPDAPRNVCTLLTYHKSDGDNPGQLAHIALDWTPVVHI